MNRREALLALTALPTITRISHAQVKPNDVIVIETDRSVSVEMAKRIEEYIIQVWPGHKCVVLGDGLKMKVVSG